jgi:hypothetical protein
MPVLQESIPWLGCFSQGILHLASPPILKEPQPVDFSGIDTRFLLKSSIYLENNARSPRIVIRGERAF